MLPRRNCLMEMSAPAKIPCVIRNMFATLCSNPRVTKVEIGTKTERILPATELDAIAIHTARHTSQLQSTPLAKRVTKGAETLETAALVTAAVRASEAVVAAKKAMPATKTLPAKFPRKLQNQFLLKSVAVTLPLRRPLIMMKTFPVKSSPPVRMTIERPAGRPIAPLTKLASPGLAWARPGEEPETTLERRPPIPIRAPARKPSTKVLSKL
mmetsp:Transcript_12163/g.36942  ORF Transcript_12163/g.36942 Transcript_12163/m.36942 type:complete len:212 (-) Transcript_12163:332-967(-)